VQERQFPESHSEALAPAERRVLQHIRARRVQGLTAGVGAALLALFIVGCPEPADLTDPGSFPKPPSSTAGAPSTAGSGAGGGSSSDACEVDCIKDVFQKQITLCKLCHTAKTAAEGGLQSSGLNLEGDGFTARLKDVPAKHGDLPAGMATCTAGDKLIDTSAPANSWLLKKIHAEQGSCGTPMPSTGMLSAAQKTCIETYVACVAGGSAAASGTAGTASGTAGAAPGGGGAGGTSGSGGAGGK
jgi:hypothetical protein